MSATRTAKSRTIVRPAVPAELTVFDWFAIRARKEGAISSAGAAAVTAEKIFFTPSIDTSLPIAEGPPPLDWEGYHTGKHGVWERFNNLVGESPNMGKLFFDEEYRWIRDEYKSGKGTLRGLQEAQVDQMLHDVFHRRGLLKRHSLAGLIDTEKFMADLETIYKKFGRSASATVWQGKYVMSKNRLGPLQVNIDFKAHGYHWRLALRAISGRPLNFFRIESSEGRNPMRFKEIVLHWKGKITDVNVHRHPDSTVTIATSASWRGLIMTCVKQGALTGGLVAAFLGAIEGFKQEGIPGALKGLAIGGLIGGAMGAVMTPLVALLSRILPHAAKVAGVLGFITLVAGIALTPSETALDPQEFHPPETDDDGNLWYLRHVKTFGTLFPEHVPHGIKIETADGVTIEFGDEMPSESAYEITLTPIRKCARGKMQWAMERTPEGSSMWWWREGSGKEYAMFFADDDTLKEFLAAFNEVEKQLYEVTEN